LLQDFLHFAQGHELGDKFFHQPGVRLAQAVNQTLGFLAGEQLMRILPDDFTKVSLEAEPRSGVLTHPYLLSAFSYPKLTSPIHRGVFLARGVLGQNFDRLVSSSTRRVSSSRSAAVQARWRSTPLSR